MPLLRDFMEARAHPGSMPEKWLLRAFGAQDSYTGKDVTQDSALKLSAVHACVKILSETVATLPLPVYRRLEPRGRERAQDHPLYELLHDQPNPDMTSMQWRETLMLHLLLWGNAWAEIEINGAGRPIALWPLMPDRTRAVRKDGKKVIITRLSGGDVALAQERVLHIPGLGYNGLMGFTPIYYAMQAIGLGLASEEFEARFFGRGARPSGWIEYPQTMSKEHREELRAQFEQMHSGIENMHRTAVLDRGLKYHEMQVNPVDAQLLETRKFTVREIARFFNVPSYLLQDTEPGASYASIEQRAIDFVRFTVRPWLVRFEQSINRALVSESEQGEVFAEFVVDGLLRGDFQTRMQGYATARQWGWLSANDIRDLENLNPLPGEEGDQYLVPLNMVPASEVGQLAPSQAPAVEEPRALQARETRADGLITLRKRIQKAHLPVMRDAAQRGVRREVEAARKAVKANLQDGPVFNRQGFMDWIEKFYAEHREYVVRQLQPAVEALSSQVAAVAMQEVGADPKAAPDMLPFSNGYSVNAAARHVQSSSGQLRQIATTAQQAQAAQAVEDRLAEWEETRADKVSGREIVEAGAAAAKAAFIAAGVTRLVWRTLGSNCPLCQTLDGKVVGIHQNFAGAGDIIDPPDGKAEPLVVEQNTSHAPLHKGCDCMVGAA